MDQNCQEIYLIRAGMSSLKPEDAIPDYSTLNPQQRQTLDQWESFFERVSFRDPSIAEL
jgi:hypothetical protein